MDSQALGYTEESLRHRRPLGLDSGYWPSWWQHGDAYYDASRDQTESWAELSRHRSDTFISSWKYPVAGLCGWQTWNGSKDFKVVRFPWSRLHQESYNIMISRESSRRYKQLDKLIVIGTLWSVGQTRLNETVTRVVLLRSRFPRILSMKSKSLLVTRQAILCKQKKTESALISA